MTNNTGDTEENEVCMCDGCQERRRLEERPHETPTGDRVTALDVLDRGLDEICSYAYDTNLSKNKMRQLIRSTCNAMDKPIRKALQNACARDKGLVEALEKIIADDTDPITGRTGVSAETAKEALAKAGVK